MMLPSRDSVRLTLKREQDVVRAGSPPAANPAPRGTAAAASPDAEADASIKPIDFPSPSLTAFWGKPTRVRGIVLLPPGYDGTRDTYPTVYRTEGFGGSLNSLTAAARRHYNLMKSEETPPMIRVFLDHSSPWGTHEFADSVNNGPWGKALTEELIPWLEGRYRMDKEPSGRFTTGHSSGGWFAIWQQVRYPNVFGGTWARAPDPVDFRSFTGINIYGRDANAYTRPDGAAQYLVRDASGKEVTSFKDYAQRENVLGDYGGQIDSFDWVFSPRGQDGRPQPLFDRATGKVDPDVARYWRENYDITAIIRRDWEKLKPQLDGKIHVIMGTMDTFHLDEAARLLDLELQVLGADADFYWMEGRGHGNLDRIDEDPNGLEKKIAWEMWAVARPDSPRKPKPAAAPASAPASAPAE
jgi:S-formylglutathione hydrolase FrmB